MGAGLYCSSSLFSSCLTLKLAASTPAVSEKETISSLLTDTFTAVLLPGVKVRLISTYATLESIIGLLLKCFDVETLKCNVETLLC